jgi:glucose/arabinose dehydrogenase
MKKVLGIITLLILIAATFYIIKNRFGDVIPAVIPSFTHPKKQSTYIPKRGKPLDFDLTVADGFQVGLFSSGLGGVRDITFSPHGTLVASVTSAGTVVALPDNNNDGIADEVVTVLKNLAKPHGVVFYNDKLYVAEESHISRYIWDEKTAAGGDIIIARFEKKLFDLPQGGRHFTRSIVFDKAGTMFVSVGSTCDVCYETHPFLASVIVSDAEGKAPRLYGKGLRNAPFITVNTQTNEVWGTEMGRDFLGDVTPPDEINIVKDGNDYGWPNCYGNKIHDGKFDTKQYFRDPCQDTIAPLYEIPAHSAPLGLTFISSPQFPSDWQGDLFVAYHGSWNSSTPVGYKVVRMKVEENTISGEEDFLSGFLQGGSAVARPVDVVFDKNGNLYVSDDKSGNIFIVSRK